jgi:hypothetical protein
LPVIGSVVFVRHAGVPPFLATRAGRAFAGSAGALLCLYGGLMVISTGLYRGIV